MSACFGLPAAALALALGAALAAGEPAGAQSAAIVTPAPGGAPWSAGELAGLRRDLDALLTAAPALKGAHLGVLALETANGSVLYARNADDAFAPASTLKLLVGSVALEKLGPDYRFGTAAALGPGSDGASALQVTGFGDPLLSARDLDGLAEAVAAKGGRVGSVAVDATLFGDTPYPAGWTWDDFGEDYAARISAATVEENVVHVQLRLGENGAVAAGALPLPDVFAAAPLTAASGTAAVGSPECRPEGGFVVVRVKAKPGAPSDVDASVDGPCVVLAGIVGSDATDVDVAVPDPPLYLGRVVLRALAAHGVDVNGAVLERAAPERGAGASGAPGAVPFVPALDSAFWAHRSPPLAAILGPRFWIPSDNLVGETLLLQLALTRSARPATRAAAFAIEREWLHSLGVDPATVSLADGCGMSQYDRITPRALAAILQHDWQGPNRQLVLDSLPVGGARGTIEGIAGSGAAGRVFAKTGSIMHARGLAGYLATKRHGAVTFAFNVDDWIGDGAALARLRAQVLARIVDD